MGEVIKLEECGCTYEIPPQFKSGERGFTCEHGTEWVVRAIVPHTVHYVVEKRKIDD